MASLSDNIKFKSKRRRSRPLEGERELHLRNWELMGCWKYILDETAVKVYERENIRLTANVGGTRIRLAYILNFFTDRFVKQGNTFRADIFLT